MTTTDTIPTFTKEIAYDRETRDFRATLDGNYIGHFNSYYEAEVALDEVAYNLVMDGQCATATELDGGSDIDTIAADYACSEAHPCANPNHNHSRNYYSDAPPAHHWARDLPAYGAGNCAGCGGTVPCGCDDAPATVEARLYCPSCAGNHELKDCPYNQPTHRTPLPVDDLLIEADAALSVCPGAFEPCGAGPHPSYAPYCRRCASGPSHTCTWGWGYAPINA